MLKGTVMLHMENLDVKINENHVEDGQKSHG